MQLGSPWKSSFESNYSRGKRLNNVVRFSHEGGKHRRDTLNLIRVGGSIYRVAAASTSKGTKGCRRLGGPRAAPRNRGGREKDADKGNEVFRAVGCAVGAEESREGRKKEGRMRRKNWSPMLGRGTRWMRPLG